jgi:glycosyltransferase involved in cell wall biosynthesis
MHAGIVPIVSYESSVDVNDEYGVLLKTCSINEIQDAVRTAAKFPAAKLKSMSRKAWEFVRANHTRERFAEEYRKAILNLMELHGIK